jgi:hypothetical protein
MASLEQILDRLVGAQIDGELWLDGSLLTEKLHPDDVDVLLHISSSWLQMASHNQADTVQWFADNLYDSLRCDSYVFVSSTQPAAAGVYSEWKRAYWIRQFGWSRSEEMKGIATITLGGGIA